MKLPWESKIRIDCMLQKRGGPFTRGRRTQSIWLVRVGSMAVRSGVRSRGWDVLKGSLSGPTAVGSNW